MSIQPLTNSVHCPPGWRALFLIPLVLVCVGFLPQAKAVTPAPDGGYPGGNTAEGQRALLSLTTGGFNTGVGYLSLGSDTTNSFNTAIGAGALLVNTAGQNTATGAGALLSNTIGDHNTANGAFALFSNTTGAYNTANGADTLKISTGTFNTGDGASALFYNSTGNDNTANGAFALQNNTTGSDNTAIGILAGFNISTANNTICIGSHGSNVDNSCFIGNIYAANEGGTISAVYVNSDGQLGTQAPPSARRFKKEIKSMEQASEAILALNPVTFHYNSDKANIPQFGLIAEEVAQVNPDLVVRDEKGEIYTVRYEAVNAMLLNEFLKQHCKVEEQETTIAQQQKQFESKLWQQEKNFVSRLAQQQKQIDELAGRLGKLSAQLEASRTAPQVVNNP